MKKIREFLNNWGMIIITPLVIFSFFNGCSAKKKAGRAEDASKANGVKMEQVDSTTQSLTEAIESLPTEKKVRDQMEVTMYRFLIYEDEIDRGKKTISDVQELIEQND
jgi:hypothetical protein